MLIQLRPRFGFPFFPSFFLSFFISLCQRKYLCKCFACSHFIKKKKEDEDKEEDEDEDKEEDEDEDEEEDEKIST